MAEMNDAGCATCPGFVVVVAIVVAVVAMPVPVAARVPPLALAHSSVPRLALVTMCHQNPCLMHQHPGSQGRKHLG